MIMLVVAALLSWASALTLNCGPFTVRDSVGEWMRVPGEHALQTEQGKLSIGGHPLRPVLRLEANGASYDCKTRDDLGPLYRRVVDSPEVLTALQNWDAWTSARRPACRPELDSVAYVHPGEARRVALVFHGVFSNPEAMRPMVRLLLDAGFNVIAPRLTGHFEMNPRALDEVDYGQWRVDAEQTFQLAKGFSPERVLLAGFSLGGLLATDLALHHRSDVERMILLSPAWRISNLVRAGSEIGGMFGISLNDVRGVAAACVTGQGYAPARGGKQVQALADYLQEKVARDPNYSVFSDLRVPMLVLTGSEDNMMSGAVDSTYIAAVCQGIPICKLMNLERVDHVGMMQAFSTLKPASKVGSTPSATIMGFVSSPWTALSR